VFEDDALHLYGSLFVGAQAVHQLMEPPLVTSPLPPRIAEQIDKGFVFSNSVRELISTVAGSLDSALGERFIKDAWAVTGYATNSVVQLSHPFGNSQTGGYADNVLLTGHSMAIVNYWMGQRHAAYCPTALLLGMPGVGKTVTTRILVAKTIAEHGERGTIILWADTGLFLLLWPSRSTPGTGDHALRLSRDQFYTLVAQHGEERHYRSASTPRSPMPQDVLLVYDSCSWPAGGEGKKAWIISGSTWVSASPQMGNFEAFLRLARPLPFVQPVLNKEQLFHVLRTCFDQTLLERAERYAEEFGVCTIRDALESYPPLVDRIGARKACLPYRSSFMPTLSPDGFEDIALHHCALTDSIPSQYAYLTAARRERRAVEAGPAAAPPKVRAEAGAAPHCDVDCFCFLSALPLLSHSAAAPADCLLSGLSLLSHAAAAPADCLLSPAPHSQVRVEAGAALQCDVDWGDLDVTKLVWEPNMTNIWLLSAEYHALLARGMDKLLEAPSNQLDSVKRAALHEGRALKQVRLRLLVCCPTVPVRTLP
jgi:hypothetical protein